MPAVDPDRLDQEIKNLLRCFKDPPRLASELLDRLEFYANRIRRLDPENGSEHGSRAYHVAQPVMRTLQRRFAAMAAAEPDSALPVARALWDTGWKEARLLAAATLQSLDGREIPRTVETWSLACRDAAIIQALAGTALLGWRSADPPAFLKQSRTWIRGRKEAKRVLALYAFRSAVDDPAFSPMPAVFEAIEKLAARVHGESRRALRQLVEALAARTPTETAHFLLDELEAGVAGVDRLIRESMEAFPVRQQGMLRTSLSAHRQAGIIRQA